MLQLLYQPWLVLPLLGWITWRLSSPLPALGRSAAVLLPVLCVALLYSPLGTAGLTATQRNRLALRETAGSLLYKLQGRF